tara:strand:- start:2985 stop:3956 length:972 start_codon:yes stop_codon:yes gene_type:complete
MNKVIIIGLGAWGTNFLRIIKNLPSKYKLVGLVDPLLDSRNSHNFLSLENFLKSNIDFDAAIITTPATTHFEITKKLLTLKKHCLVEKPLTTSSKESFELYEIAKKNKVKLLVDHTFLYDPALKYVLNKLKNKFLGELLHISFERTNLGPVRNDVNTNWDLTSHDISILSAIFNTVPNQVTASGASFLSKNNEDIVNISLNYKKVFVTLISSWLHPEKTRKIKFVGSKKMLTWDNMSFDQEIKIYDKSISNDTEKNKDLYKNLKLIRNGKISIPYVKKEEPLKNVILDFHNLINNKKNNSINNEKLTMDTIMTLESINKKLKS